jgi:hypothetical protein
VKSLLTYGKLFTESNRKGTSVWKLNQASRSGLLPIEIFINTPKKKERNEVNERDEERRRLNYLPEKKAGKEEARASERKRKTEWKIDSQAECCEFYG